MMRDAIDDTEHSFWRSRFRQKYEFLPGLEFRSFADQQETNKALASLYQKQSKILRRGTYYDFFTGYSRGEQKVVFLLTDLIIGKLSFKADFYSLLLTCYRIFPRNR